MIESLPASASGSEFVAYRTNVVVRKVLVSLSDDTRGQGDMPFLSLPMLMCIARCGRLPSARG